MKRIAIYGKGGIGKSTLATGVSLVMARRAMRVLHVGGDPKHDSSRVLVEDPEQFKTVVDLLFHGEKVERADLVMRGIAGIDCVESGGPQAGRGCGGRAVSRSFEIFDDVELVDASRYDAVVYDVLGDVVCGGFAAPMRRSAGCRVVIVLSEEMMAAYAANRIAAAVTEFERNGVVLAGLVVNLRDNRADLVPIKRFAERLSTQILTVLPRDPLVCEAEIYRKSIVDYAPDSPVGRQITELVDRVLDLDPASMVAPTPMADTLVRQIMRDQLGGDSQLPSPPTNPQSTITDWSKL